MCDVRYSDENNYLEITTWEEPDMVSSLSDAHLNWTAAFTSIEIRQSSGTAGNGSARDATPGPDVVLRSPPGGPGMGEAAGAPPDSADAAIDESAPGGGASVTRLKIGKPLVSTDRKQASSKGQELGLLLKSGKLKPEDKQQIMHLLEFYEGQAYESFANQLMSETRGTPGAVEEFESKESKPSGPNEPWTDTTDSSLIIPTSDPKAERGGFKVSFAAQIFEETSESTAVEVYNDVSGSAGVSLEIPFAKVLKLKFSVDAKHGKKWTDKSETKDATRKGQTISRSFTVKHMEREVVNKQSKKVYVAPAPIAKYVTHEPVGVNPEIQHGYMVVPDEGGQPWGPFWNAYAGFIPDNQSGLREAWDVLGKEQKKIAEDLVFGPPDG